MSLPTYTELPSFFNASCISSAVRSCVSSAYAISADMNDPVVQALHALLDHTLVTDQRLHKLAERLSQAGLECPDALEEDAGFDPKELNKALE